MSVEAAKPKRITPSRPLAPAESQRNLALPAVLFGLIVAFLPILLTYLPQLWSREYYRFFPFAIGTTLGMAVLRGEPSPSLKASNWRWAARGVCFLASLGILVLGYLAQSPWPCYVAFIAVMAIILDCWNEKGCDRSLAYLVLPSLLTVRPPLHFDERAVQYLQTLTSALSSDVLAALKIDHILLGNIIQPVASKALLVKEACSGVQSLFTLMFLAAFIAALNRYSVARAILLIASAVFWALGMNMFRVIVIAVAQTQFSLDLTTGWQHDAIGYAGILVALMFLLSTDRLLLFLIGGISDDPMKNPSVNYFVSAWNRLFVAPDLPVLKQRGNVRKEDQPGRTKNSAVSFREPIMLTISGGVLLCFLVSLPAYGLPGLGRTGASGSIQPIAQLSNIESEWLPASAFEGHNVLDFNSDQRGASSPFGGGQSETWIVETPTGAVRHSIDHPFDGFHNLSICYRAIGWRMEQLTERNGSSEDAEWPLIQGWFVKPTGENAFLCFSLFTTEGDPVLPEGETNLLTGVMGRLAEASSRGRTTIQVQTLYESNIAPDATTTNRIAKLHQTFREAARKQFLEDQSEAHDLPTTPVADELEATRSVNSNNSLPSIDDGDSQ